jgi:hypothetical protein
MMTPKLEHLFLDIVDHHDSIPVLQLGSLFGRLPVYGDVYDMMDELVAADLVEIDFRRNEFGLSYFLTFKGMWRLHAYRYS